MSTQQSKSQHQSDFERLLDRLSPMVNQALSLYAWPNSDAPKRLVEAMNYSLSAGGKRLRPMLVICGSEAVGGDPNEALPVAAAFEMIHTYSLIHDDLPSMDDDDLRRGKPTCHKAFDEATAILAGDAMCTYAFQAILQGVSDATKARDAAVELAQAAGLEGMVGGQVADLEGEGTKPDLEQLQYIHRRKTGALIASAVVCGGILGGATEPELVALRSYGEKVGLAFQVIDDVLDETATAEELGKSPGKDSAAGKQTYPALMGLAAAKEYAAKLVHEALADIDGLSGEGLGVIANYFVARSY
ncbi:polyprenyl synthetase family protein [Planctomycetota bacterium]|nr:polyprenyl synthetase family protein [Planctomycetota bacterium]